MSAVTSILSSQAQSDWMHVGHRADEERAVPQETKNSEALLVAIATLDSELPDLDPHTKEKIVTLDLNSKIEEGPNCGQTALMVLVCNARAAFKQIVDLLTEIEIQELDLGVTVQEGPYQGQTLDSILLDAAVNQQQYDLLLKILSTLTETELKSLAFVENLRKAQNENPHYIFDLIIFACTHAASPEVVPKLVPKLPLEYIQILTFMDESDYGGRLLLGLVDLAKKLKDPQLLFTLFPLFSLQQWEEISILQPGGQDFWNQAPIKTQQEAWQFFTPFIEKLENGEKITEDEYQKAQSLIGSVDVEQRGVLFFKCCRKWSAKIQDSWTKKAGSERTIIDFIEEEKSERAIKHLVEHILKDPDSYHINGWTPLMSAICFKNDTLIDLILGSLLCKNPDGVLHALFFSRLVDNRAAARKILSHLKEKVPQSTYYSLLFSAALPARDFPQVDAWQEAVFSDLNELPLGELNSRLSHALQSYQKTDALIYFLKNRLFEICTSDQEEQAKWIAELGQIELSLQDSQSLITMFMTSVIKENEVAAVEREEIVLDGDKDLWQVVKQRIEKRSWLSKLQLTGPIPTTAHFEIVRGVPFKQFCTFMIECYNALCAYKLKKSSQSVFVSAPQRAKAVQATGQVQISKKSPEFLSRQERLKMEHVKKHPSAVLRERKSLPLRDEVVLPQGPVREIVYKMQELSLSERVHDD